MKLNAGLWIDHRKCVLVLVNDKKTDKKIINSNAEKHLRSFDGKEHTSKFEAQKVIADDSQERHYTAHLHAYFDEIVHYIKEAEFILIFGPGEAKTEFVKHLNKNRISAQIEVAQTSDKMTDSQIIAKVRDHVFKLENK